MLQEVTLGQKSLSDYTHIAGKELIERIRELAEPLEGAARPPRQRHRLRRRRLGDPLHDRAADARRRPRRPLARDLRQGRVLQRDQAPPQLAAGRRGDADRRAVGAVRRDQRDQRRGPARRVGHDHRPRPAADRAAPRRGREEPQLDLALPHRPLRAQPGADRPPAAADRGVRRDRLAHARLRADGDRTATTASASSRRRSTRSRRRTWPSRPTTPPSSATSSGSTSTGR